MPQYIVGRSSISAGVDNTDISRIRDDWLAEGGQGFGLPVLILAVVNVFAAVLTIGSICYNAWSRREWDFFRSKTRSDFSSSKDQMTSNLKQEVDTEF